MTSRMSCVDLSRLRRWLWRHRWPLGLCAAGLVLRLLTPDPLFDSDPVGYFEGAESVFEHGRYTFSDGSAVFWPMGYPLLLVIGFAVFGAHPYTAVIVSALASGGSLALTYALASRWGSERIAQLLGLLLLGSYVHWNLGGSVLADASSFFFLVLTLYAFVRWSEERRERWGAITFLAIGAAMLLRTQNALLLPIVLLLLVLQRRIGLLARPLPLAGLVGAGLLYLPQALYSLQEFGTLAPYLDPTIDAFRPDYAWGGGFEGRSPQAGWLLFDAFVSPRLGSPLLLPFVAWGLWALWREARGRVFLPLALLGVGFYVLFATYYWYTTRFLMVFYLPVLLPAAVGIDRAWRRIAPTSVGQALRGVREWRRSLSLLLLLLLLIGPVWAVGVVGVSAQRGVHEARAQAAQWVAEQTPATALALSYGEPSFAYYAQRATFPLSEAFGTLTAAVNSSAATYLVVLADPSRLPPPYPATYASMTEQADRLRALFGATEVARFESGYVGKGLLAAFGDSGSLLPEEVWIVYRLGA